MNPNQPLRIGIWCAVSGKPQAAPDKVSLEDQESAGRRLADAVGGQVVAIYSVPGHTRDIWRWEEAEQAMDAYRRLRQDAEGHRLDLLWAFDVDRLGRDPALGQQVISVVERNGGEVYLESAPHPIGHKTMAHRYITAIQSVRAGEDQALRIQRYKSGMRGRIMKKGLLPARVPFYLDAIRDEEGEITGYKYNERVAALDFATDLFLASHSYAEIARRLNESPYRPPEGKRWWHYSVILMLGSDIPAGYPSWGPHRPAEPSTHIPVRWDAETYAAVIRQRERRSRGGYIHPGGGPYAGVAVCGRCGSHMTRYQGTWAHRHAWAEYRLRCGRHACKSIYPDMICHPNYLAEADITAVLTEFFAQFLATPEVLDEILATVGQGNEVERLRADLARADAMIIDLDRRRERLAHELAAGNLDGAMYRQVDDKLLNSLEAEQKRAGDLRRAIESLPDAGELREILMSLARDFSHLVEMAEPAEIAGLLQAAKIQVICEEGRVVRIGVG